MHHDARVVTPGWRRGVVVECRTCDQEVTGSSLGGALRRKNSGQVSHTYVPVTKQYNLVPAIAGEQTGMPRDTLARIRGLAA